jgi:hypothetical protein
MLKELPRVPRRILGLSCVLDKLSFPLPSLIPCSLPDLIGAVAVLANAYVSPPLGIVRPVPCYPKANVRLTIADGFQLSLCVIAWSTQAAGSCSSIASARSSFSL